MDHYEFFFCLFVESLQMNALSEMGVEYIDIEKEDTSQLSAQEAVVKSAKLGKKGPSPVLPTLGDPEPFSFAFLLCVADFCKDLFSLIFLPFCRARTPLL